MSVDPSLNEALKTLRERRASIDDAIAALERLIGSEYASSTEPRSAAKSRKSPVRRGATGQRGARTEAVVEILRDRGPEGLTPNELASALDERGVPLRSDDPPRAARAAGNRARERDPHIVLENGRFVYRPNSAEPARGPTLPFEEHAGEVATE
jgi:hypothetical protein